MRRMGRNLTNEKQYSCVFVKFVSFVLSTVGVVIGDMLDHTATTLSAAGADFPSNTNIAAAARYATVH
jgi:hypothetical protein